MRKKQKVKVAQSLFGEGLFTTRKIDPETKILLETPIFRTSIKIVNTPVLLNDRSEDIEIDEYWLCVSRLLSYETKKNEFFTSEKYVSKENKAYTYFHNFKDIEKLSAPEQKQFDEEDLSTIKLLSKYYRVDGNLVRKRYYQFVHNHFKLDPIPVGSNCILVYILYFKISKINHSCTPNCYLSHASSSAEDIDLSCLTPPYLVSSKPLKKNEELYLSYSDCSDLERVHNFKCGFCS